MSERPMDDDSQLRDVVDAQHAELLELRAAVARVRAVNAAQHSELLALRAAVARVRALHSPDADGDCLACGLDADEEAARWEGCATIAALGDPGREDAP